MTEEKTTLTELARLFLRLGATAFGGPAAHIAMMHDEVVTRRQWLSEAQFLDLVGATHLIPGPNSTELAIHIGWQRRRAAGLLVAGLAFIVPAMLITAIAAWFYVRYGSVPAAKGLLYGVKPVIVAVVIQAIVALAPKALKSPPLRLLGALTVLFAAYGAHELWLLLLAGLTAIIALPARPSTNQSALVPPSLLPWAAVAGTSGVSLLTLPSLFWIFFKTGSVLFGSGYVLIAFLRADLVQRLGWLTEAQLIDAIAVGQVTPGPVFTTATFIGYVLLGPYGALVATVGIFLPAFIFVALSGPFVPRIRSSPRAAAFLDGVNVASLALMAVVTAQLARAALVDLPSLTFALLAAVLLLRFKLNATWLVLGGAAAGVAIHGLGLGLG